VATSGATAAASTRISGSAATAGDAGADPHETPAPVDRAAMGHVAGRLSSRRHARVADGPNSTSNTARERDRIECAISSLPPAA
jgi:hypothetical protein